MTGDIELDGTKLSPEEADERWLRAGRVVRENAPDVYRRTFALAEGQAAGIEHGTDPDGDARIALVSSGVVPTSDPERDRIRAAVRRVLDQVQREPLPGVRFTSIDMMLRAIDWSLVPFDLALALFRMVMAAAPLEALQQAHPHAATPVPIGAGLGLEAVAVELGRIADHEAEQGLNIETKGEN